MEEERTALSLDLEKVQTELDEAETALTEARRERDEERERCARIIDVQFQWDDREEVAAAIRSGKKERTD